MKPPMEKRTHEYDESELIELAKRVFLESFPNSARIGCPDTAVREALASGRKNLAEHWDVFDHVCICSPCFAEFLASRKQVLRRKRIWLSLGLGIIVLLSLASYATLRISGDGSLLLSNADLWKGIPALPSPPPEAVVKSNTIAVLNFRHRSVTRGDIEVPVASRPPTLRRGILSLRIELPLFSRAGHYRVSLRSRSGKSLTDWAATAHVFGGRTVLDPINIDLSSVEPGGYVLSFETAGMQSPLNFAIRLE